MTEKQGSATKIDPLAEFHRLKEETAVINAKMRASAPLLNSSGSSSDALLGIILKELKAMRVEVKEVKEDVKRIEENQEKMQEDVTENKENLKLIKEDIRKMKEAQKQSESRITENLKTMMLKMYKIQEDVTSNEKNLKAIDSKTDEIVKKNAVSEAPIKMDIKEKICGKWQRIDSSFLYYSYKIEGNKFFKRCRYYSVDEYTLGVKNYYGWIVTVENNKIIRKSINANGEVDGRFEYYIEDGKLVKDCYFKNVWNSKYLFERVGDPDFA